MSKKKVLYFVPQFPVLTETFIAREISKLLELDNLDISVFSLEPGTGELPENVEDKLHYERLDLKTALSAAWSYIFLHPLKIFQIHKLVTGKDRIPYLLGDVDENDPRTELSLLGRFHKSRLIHFLKGIAYAKLFEKCKPDHIHVHFLSDSSTIAMVAAKVLDIPFSISAHARDVFVEGSLISVKAKEAKFIAVCNGNAWKKTVDLANDSGSSGNIRLIYHGIDLRDIEEAEPKFSTEIPFVFTVARLVEKKGLEYLIEAAHILKERGIDFVCKIAGPGPMYGELEELIDKLGVRDRVEIVGEGDGIPNREILQYLKSADIFAFAGIQTQEGDVDGVPTVTIEAALAKLPVIATNAGSITDLVTDETGIVVPQRDAEAIANALEKLIYNASLRSELGNKAYEQARNMFNLDKNIKELEDLLLS